MTAPASAPTAAKPSRIHIEWVGGHRFDAGRPNGPTARIDGEGETGQSPPETLLSALATCVSYDVIDILAKQRTPLESLKIDIVGERVDTIPRHYKYITLNFRIAGKGIEKEQESPARGSKRSRRLEPSSCRLPSTVPFGIP